MLVNVISEQKIRKIVKNEIQSNLDVIYKELDKLRIKQEDLDRITKRTI